MALLAPVSSPASAASTSRLPLAARVVWIRADHIYVVLDDTAVVVPGDTLLVLSGKKQVAAARIVSMAEGGLAVARVVSGTLARERKLDRLRVVAARAPLPSPSTLRVGFPSIARAARWGCGPWMLRPPLGLDYRVEPTGRRPGYHLTREAAASVPNGSAPADAARAPGAAWPDTIVAILFDDAADEEIALERGDLDTALFGPGELSSRMKETARWRDRVLAAPENLDPSAPDSSALSACAAQGFDCPLLTAPELMPYVRSLGAAAFLGMMRCGAEQDRP